MSAACTRARARALLVQPPGAAFTDEGRTEMRRGDATAHARGQRPTARAMWCPAAGRQGRAHQQACPRRVPERVGRRWGAHRTMTAPIDRETGPTSQDFAAVRSRSVDAVRTSQMHRTHGDGTGSFCRFIAKSGGLLSDFQ